MSSKKSKLLRKEVHNTAAALYDEVKAQVNAMPFRLRLRFALRILWGRW